MRTSADLCALCRRWVSQDKMPHSVSEPPTSVDAQAVAALLRALIAAVHKP
jgi:hypothetical protein